MTETSGRYDRKNFVLNAFEGASWVAGASLISIQTVLPALVTRLGGGNVAVGAIALIAYVGVFLPQVFAARYGQTLEWKKPWVVGFGFAQRIAVLTIGAIILSGGNTHPLLAAVLFFVVYAVNQILTGITSPVWFDLYAKLTPLERRGRLTGARNSLAGGLAFLCGIMLTWLLATFGFPLNYALTFFLAFVLQFISVILQSQLVEEYPSKTSPRQDLAEYLQSLPTVLRENIPFRKFLAASALLILATMPLSFYTVYALARFAAGENVVGEFTLTMVVGQILGALLNGYLADRFGNKLALVSTSSAMLTASILALVAPSLDWFRIVFLFLGIHVGSDVMTRYNLAIEYAPVQHRSTYVGLMNTILAPLYLSGLLGGWLSNSFGYHAVFIAGALCSTIGIVLLIASMEEPRMARRVSSGQ